MKNFFVCVILFTLVCSLSVFAKSQESKDKQVQSTEGVVIDSQTSQNITKSKEDKNPAKTKRKNRNKYLKYVTKTEKAINRKRIKEKDLYFLNKQLEIKKHKLEEVNSRVKKGENQK